MVYKKGEQLAVMNEPLTLADWLRAQRRLLDLTQSELAARASCSPVTVKKIEAGDLRPSKQLAELLAEALHVPADRRDDFVRFARTGSSDFPLTTAAAPFSPNILPPATPPTTASDSAIANVRPINNLPAQLTALIGREREISAAIRLLRQPGVRLITLTGPPGAGKTRLSIEIAEALAGDFADGICFVALEPVTDPQMVLPTIAQALDVKETSGLNLAAAIRQFLSQRTLLLVLDNFEQVVAAAPAVADLLSAARNLKVLVSSRETLHIYGEREFPVPPLALPDVNRLPPLEALALYPAIGLFVERAQAFQPTFELTIDNADAVAHICAWLDGLPLAIEMAAARIRWSSPKQVLQQLSQRLTALTGNLRDLSPRQQTMRGAIDWSYNLLSPDEAEVFNHTAVFAGGFTSAAVAAVLGRGAADNDEDDWRVLHLLQGLVEKSLLRCEQSVNGSARFWMLEVMHAYALEKLEAAGQMDAGRQRHAAYFGSLAERTLAALRGVRPKETMEWLKLEINNLRTALEWLSTADPATGLRVACFLAFAFWPLAGFYSEAERWLEQLLAAADRRLPPEQELALRSQALHLSANMASFQGNQQLALERANAALALSLQVGDRETQRRSLRILASLALANSDYPRAEALYHEAFALWQPGDDPVDAVNILNGLGLAAKDQGDYPGAIELHERSRTIAQQSDYRIGEVHSATLQSIAAYWQGEYRQAEQLARRCMAMREELGEYVYMAYAKEIVAMAVGRQGDVPTSMQLLGECLAQFRSVSNSMGIPLILNDMGQVAHMQGDLLHALRLHQEALAAALVVNDRRRIAFCLEGLAMVAIDLEPRMPEQPVLATQVLAATATLRRMIHAPLPPSETQFYNTAISRLHQLLSAKQVEAAWSAGEALSMGDAARIADELARRAAV